MAKNDAIINDQELPFSEEGLLQIYDDQDADNDEHDDSSLYCSLCSTIDDYDILIYHMVEEIKFLQADIVRWRQAIIKYLSPEWADGLRQDIFDNIFRSFEDYDAYKLFINRCCNGSDPLEDKKHSALLRRLKDGTDETSIDYL